MSLHSLAKARILWQPMQEQNMDTLISIAETVGIILLVILLFNLMIFVHELGHFLAGKWRGAYIDRFQIWFGQPIWSKTYKGVRWGLGWLPLGGFVSLPQMEDMQQVEGKADIPAGLKPLKPLDKAIIAAAGPLFSLLLAYVFAVVVWVVGKPVMEMPGTQVGYIMPDSTAAAAGIHPGDRILAIDGRPVTKWMGNMEGVRELVAMSENEQILFTISRTDANGENQTIEIACGYKIPETSWWQRKALRQVGIMPAYPVIVGDIHPGSPAEKAGLQPGQQITALNGSPVYTPFAITQEIEKGSPLQLTLRSEDGTVTSTMLTPEIPQNWKGREGAYPVLGFTWQQKDGKFEFEHPSPQSQVNQSLSWMQKTVAKLCAPGSSIGMEHLSGPVGIGAHMFQMLRSGDGLGWRLVLWFSVVLNVNLAILNLLPLPVLDGGHVVLSIAEKLRGKPVSTKYLDKLMVAFFFILMALIIFVTLKDVGDLVDKSDAPAELPPPVFATPSE